MTSGKTHVITIPGTTFKCFINSDFTDPVAMMAKLSRTTTAPAFPNKRRPKALPVLSTIEEWNN